MKLNAFRRRALAGLAVATFALNGTSAVNAAPAKAAPASAANASAMISAKNPKAVFDVVRSVYPDATLGKADNGSAKIEYTEDKIITTIRFMNCQEDGSNCTTLNFYAGWANTGFKSLDRINEYNANRRFSRAYLDDVGDPCVEMDLDLDFAGLPRQNVVEYLNTWSLTIHDFRDFISE